jgi:hypothetical protein
MELESNMENVNTLLIRQGLTQCDRLLQLNSAAITPDEIPPQRIADKAPKVKARVIMGLWDERLVYY